MRLLAALSSVLSRRERGRDARVTSPVTMRCRDAVFGQWGTVTNAQDRYALQETSFLLQRIEEYEGVVILATNLRQNFDPAFSRRIQQIIDFPTPDDEGRMQIWRHALSAVDNDLDEGDVAGIAHGVEAVSGGDRPGCPERHLRSRGTGPGGPLR